jgi:ribonuclease J
MEANQIKFISLGGISDVTKNMYLYEYGNEILIVDCGLGFADETMLGVDLLLPDVSYLLKTNKKIVGMIISHGHEDHLGALPYILPQLPSFPIYAAPLAAAFANAKLKEFNINTRVKAVSFDGGEVIIGSFKAMFIRMTHSVPDTSNIFIKTPIGNFYHGSDYKFDLTPADGKKVEFSKILEASKQGVLCLMSDCLRAEKKGYTPSETELSESFEAEMRKTNGKFILTTYSSNISRLNQAIQIARKLGRKVCFVGRSLLKAKEIACDLGYMKLDKNIEVPVNQLKRFRDNQLVLFVAGSQGQENSALARIAQGDFKEVKLNSNDVVVFSSDPIPGNEVNINFVIDTISKRGTRVVYSEISDDFHVSGHGASLELMLMMSLLRPKRVLPIGGTYRQMVAYRNLARKQGYQDSDILLAEDSQEVIFTKDTVTMGKKIEARNIYVDEISGEEVEHYVLRDRQKIAKDGVVIILAEVDSTNGELLNAPTIIIRGLGTEDSNSISQKLAEELKRSIVKKDVKVTDWFYIRKRIGDISESFIYKNIKKSPLVLPVVIEI